jgi:hypothetical protein
MGAKNPNRFLGSSSFFKPLSFSNRQASCLKEFHRHQQASPTTSREVAKTYPYMDSKLSCFTA